MIFFEKIKAFYDRLKLIPFFAWFTAQRQIFLLLLLAIGIARYGEWSTAQRCNDFYMKEICKIGDWRPFCYEIPGTADFLLNLSFNESDSVPGYVDGNKKIIDVYTPS